MQSLHKLSRIFSVGLLAGLLAGCATAQPDHSTGFVSIFDGKTLNGWRVVDKHGAGYGVSNGVIYCSKGGGGKLLTEKEYSDFTVRFEFKMEDFSNNGLGIRTPFEGDAAYVGMEIQILGTGYPGQLRPEQYHGSVYGVFAARRGALKPPGQWNVEEVTALGRHIKVVLNGQTILDADLNTVTDPKILAQHPGLLRERGHLGFLGHNDYLEFRNISVKDLSGTKKDNVPPEGFTALFNGKDLTGWKGLLKEPNDNPIKRDALTEEARQTAQVAADENMRAHWKVENGAFVFDGKGRSLCTARDYANFEMLVDWKIPAFADSGIYLRGSPQVQIWDPYSLPTKAGSEVGSGGLYNNQKNPSKPTKVADKPIGEWNQFRILMQGEKVSIYLNNELVTPNVTLENYWDRKIPIFPTGQIELQNHGNTLYFKNIYLRELPAK